MTSYERVLAFAGGLPGVVIEPFYGDPAAKVAANGRTFVAPGREPATSFCVMIDLDTVQMLIETDPDTFYQIPHYHGYGAVLVRFDGTDPDRVRRVIEQAHDQAAALKPVKPRKKKA